MDHVEQEYEKLGYTIEMNDDDSCVVYHDGGFLSGIFYWKGTAIEWIKNRIEAQIDEYEGSK